MKFKATIKDGKTGELYGYVKFIQSGHDMEIKYFLEDKDVESCLKEFFNTERIFEIFMSSKFDDHKAVKRKPITHSTFWQLSLYGGHIGVECGVEAKLGAKRPIEEYDGSVSNLLENF